MRNPVTILFLFLVLSTLPAAGNELHPRTIMDEGQCRPQYDPDSGFWGFDCLYLPDPDAKSDAKRIKIVPQFSWASPFINGRARVLLGCRLASCQHEPKGHHFDKRLYVFIGPEYAFEPRDSDDPEVWNPKNYAVYNEAFSHVGSFNQDYIGLACVAYEGSVAYINREGNIVFAEREDGRISIPSTPQLSDYLDQRRLDYVVEKSWLVVEKSPELIDYLVGTFRPPLTPVIADYYVGR